MAEIIRSEQIEKSPGRSLKYLRLNNPQNPHQSLQCNQVGRLLNMSRVESICKSFVPVIAVKSLRKPTGRGDA